MQYISSLPQGAGLDFPRGVVLLGSTGSIGSSALKVLAAHPDRFRVLALAGGRNVELLARQIAAFKPEHAAVIDDDAAERLTKLLPRPLPRIHVGPAGYEALAALPEAGWVLSAQVGAAGLAGTVAAARAGKVICLANKESLVLAGGLIRAICARTGACILPVDSEHHALFMALHGRKPESVARLVLTASGGPFRGFDAARLEHVTVEQALRHPNWNMGAKITIDSATCMNKGLEIIEAAHLYGVGLDRIAVLVHPESIIHSLVEFNDASLMAHLGAPDMRTAIAGCLTWPENVDSGVARIDLAQLGKLTFEQPDEAAFPCLGLAREALATGGTAPVVLNAANEIAVEYFLAGRLSFAAIPRLIRHCLGLSFEDRGAAPAPAREHGAPLTPQLGGQGDAASVMCCGELDPGGESGVQITLDRIAAVDKAAREAAREAVARGGPDMRG